MLFSFLRKNQFEIYTDGSAKHGWGSWAYVWTHKGESLKESSGRVRRASSNAMEFQAAIEALRALPTKSKVTLYSDSRILVDAMTSGHQPPILLTQIHELSKIAQSHTITWKWIQAHAGLKFNERCDELCVQARLFKQI